MADLIDADIVEYPFLRFFESHYIASADCWPIDVLNARMKLLHSHPHRAFS
jgi:hypothetical protein